MLPRGCPCHGGAAAGVGVSVRAPEAAILSMAPASCLSLLLPGIYCFHFPWHWEPNLITDIFMCINNICSAAWQDSEAREMRTWAPGESWGAAGARRLSQPHAELSFIEILLVLGASPGQHRLGYGSPDPGGVSGI